MGSDESWAIFIKEGDVGEVEGGHKDVEMT